uniref:Fucolectin tachylectin-4 pentraxin-1 domain-containing protein n=1 Tax=Hucho hucho TaxID=62062 RepID=A0A4W5LMG2_9TELE
YIKKCIVIIRQIIVINEQLCDNIIYFKITYINVALKGVATQSSLYGDGQAHNAIDGNRESNYHKRSCTHTEQDTNPWWRVDLLDVYRVTAVTITNRGDVVPERLDGAEIRIGNSLENNGINNPRCVVISHIPAGETNTFQCNEMEGRYVVVVIPGQNKILTLPLPLFPSFLPSPLLFPIFSSLFSNIHPSPLQ